jgi:hypothetical protein
MGGRCFYLLNDCGITAINTFGGKTKAHEDGRAWMAPTVLLMTVMNFFGKSH